ncbi:phycocyanobilin lyase [Hydrocoleum sp. CS-953]|uniref:phycobiliprotein lyase n=1 Tax=Hydrocoleum sp. CS-953 TaxID=1671698 RepID=UPI000B9AF8B8|nr:phycobiliprotein lyase [Hydrocoleum sp. CS-953]OZH55709.1 phycocyanobilin lyase [Hydrocoleum sp. CS-953]
MKLQYNQQTLEVVELGVTEYFQRSEGQWHSERRYYTLPEGNTQEIVSYITIKFLEQGSPELIELAQLHKLNNPETAMICGSYVSWVSQDSFLEKKQSEGSTVFGVKGSILYRDRGFATSNPIIAKYHLSDPNTLCLRTEYNGSVFEEEIKQIGHKYRTRQTIISRAGEQKMIGQYLEKRILNNQ